YLNIYKNENNNGIVKLDIIKNIIYSRNNREISIKEYNLLKENLKELLYGNFMRKYNMMYGEEIDYLLKMSNDFYLKKEVTTTNVGKLKELIKENVKLRFTFYMLENQKYIMENTLTYGNFMNIKTIID
ncbi:hypothetical protein, partial [Clostridium novyi]|uniref:hypothetical protein n=1 Tax=Clostridium novyi TaxID=1542 RepID=UPI00058023FD